jgi:hypothetical protein
MATPTSRGTHERGLVIWVVLFRSVRMHGLRSAHFGPAATLLNRYTFRSQIGSLVVLRRSGRRAISGFYSLTIRRCRRFQPFCHIPISRLGIRPSSVWSIPRPGRQCVEEGQTDPLPAAAFGIIQVDVCFPSALADESLGTRPLLLPPACLSCCSRMLLIHILE